jgi:hypothetical protein
MPRPRRPTSPLVGEDSSPQEAQPIGEVNLVRGYCLRNLDESVEVFPPYLQQHQRLNRNTALVYPRPSNRPLNYPRSASDTLAGVPAMRGRRRG